MPIVCVNRPNRSRPRRFRQSDVVRIFGYAVDSGEDARIMIRAIIERFLPQCKLVCDDEFDEDRLGDALQELGKALEAAIALDKLLKKLRRFPLVKILLKRVRIITKLIDLVGRKLLTKR